MRGTSASRRLLGGCVAVGAVAGTAAGVGLAAAFDSTADAVDCPAAQTADGLCRQLDLLGFPLNSPTEAALTIGPLIGFLAFVTAAVLVLYSAGHHHEA